MHDIFLSYRRKDTGPYTAWLYSHLNRRFPGRVFFDVKRIDAGAKFTEEIKREVSACRVLLAMIGPDWVTVRSEQSGKRRLDSRTDLVRVEIEMALKRDDAIVVPVLAGDDVEAPDAARDDLPPQLAPIATRNAFRITYENFDDGAGRLIAQIEEILGETAQPAVAPASNPETREAQLLVQAETAVRDGDWPAAARALQAAAFLAEASPEVLIRLRWVQWRYRLSQLAVPQSADADDQDAGWTDAEQFRVTISDGVRAFDDNLDRRAADAACGALIQALRQRDTPFPEAAARRILIELSLSGLFDLAETVAGALIETDQDSHAVRRLQGMAMIEQDKISAAIQILERLETESRFDPFENNEVRGLLGRAYQRRYALSGPGDRRRANLERALRYFYDVFAQEANAALWHGISTVSLLFRAQRDGITLPAFPDPAALARVVVETVERRDIERQADMWCFAAAAEASAGLGRRTDALRWTDRYIRSDYADRLELKRMQRHLEDVWQPATGAPIVAEMLTLINARLLVSRHGQVMIDPSDVQQPRAVRTELAQIVQQESAQTVDWFRDGLSHCRSIARIERSDGSPVGTGFLVAAADLHASLGSGMVLLTCAYIVGPDALRPEDVMVRFMAQEGGPAFRAARVLWTSPLEDLDTTVLELAPPPTGFPVYQIAADTPVAISRALDVYVMGHAGGRDLSLSSGALISVDENRLHYRLPTEPGSGGSPILNERWELLAIHHLRRPDSSEGIRITAIREALART